MLSHMLLKRYIIITFKFISTICVTNLKTNILFKRFSALFAGVDGIRVRVAFVSDKSTRVLTALATLGANERLALVVVTSQMLLQIVLIFEPALAIRTGALNSWPTILEVQTNVFLEDGLILDFLATNMANIRSLAVLHANVHLHVVFRSKARKRSGFKLISFSSKGNHSYALCFGHSGQMNLRSLAGTCDPLCSSRRLRRENRFPHSSH